MAYVTRGVGGRGIVLINDGFRYQRNKSFVSMISWRCRRQDCRAILHTRTFDVDDQNAAIRVLKVSLILIYVVFLIHVAHIGLFYFTFSPP